MKRFVCIVTKTGVKNIPYDSVFPTQNKKKFIVEFSDIKGFVPGLKREDVISISVKDI